MAAIVLPAAIRVPASSNKQLAHGPKATSSLDRDGGALCIVDLRARLPDPLTLNETPHSARFSRTLG